MYGDLLTLNVFCTMRKLFLFLLILFIVPLHVAAQSYQRSLDRGDSCMKVYDYYNALSFYKQAQKQRNDNIIKMKIASCYYFRASYKQCIGLLKTVSTDSLTHDSFRELYYSLGAIGDVAHQVFYGMTLVRTFPRDSHIVADLMNVLVSPDYDHSDMAIYYGEDYCKTDSFNTEVNRALGEAYFMERKFEQCINTYRRVFAVGDTTYNSLYYTAGAFAYMERLDSSVYYFAKAVKMKPKMAVGLYRLGVAETQLGRYEDAVLHLKKAAELYEPDKSLMFTIYKNMGESRLCQKNFKEAYLYWGYALAYVDDNDLAEKRKALGKRIGASFVK